MADRPNTRLLQHLHMYPACSERIPTARSVLDEGMLCLQGTPCKQMMCLPPRRLRRSQHHTRCRCWRLSWNRMIQPHMPCMYANQCHSKNSQLYSPGMLSGPTRDRGPLEDIPSMRRPRVCLKRFLGCKSGMPHGSWRPKHLKICLDHNPNRSQLPAPMFRLGMFPADNLTWDHSTLNQAGFAHNPRCTDSLPLKASPGRTLTLTDKTSTQKTQPSSRDWNHRLGRLHWNLQHAYRKRSPGCNPCKLLRPQMLADCCICPLDTPSIDLEIVRRQHFRTSQQDNSSRPWMPQNPKIFQLHKGCR